MSAKEVKFSQEAREKMICGVEVLANAVRVTLGPKGRNVVMEKSFGALKLGIVDPTKVVRTALQDAASVAGLLITTEAMVAEKPKKETPAPAMPPGGMDY